MANKIEMSGFIAKPPKYSHTFYGEKFYEFYISCKRNSGVCDTVPCMVSEALVNEINEHQRITLFGEIRSYTKKIGEKNKLFVYIFVEATDEYKGEDKNIVELQGIIHKQPVFRTTPLGRDVADVFVISRRQRSHKSDYLPCLAWGRSALRAANMPTRTKVNAVGRFQNRRFNKKVENKTIQMTAYEISLSSILPYRKTMGGCKKDDSI